MKEYSYERIPFCGSLMTDHCLVVFLYLLKICSDVHFVLYFNRGTHTPFSSLSPPKLIYSPV